jgi:hypothetical protein
MKQVSSNVLGEVYSSIPQKSYASVLVVTEFGFGGGGQVIGMKTQTQAYYIFPQSVSSSPVTRLYFLDCLILSRRKDDSSKLKKLFA